METHEVHSHTAADLLIDARVLLSDRSRWSTGMWGDYYRGMEARNVCLSGAILAAECSRSRVPSRAPWRRWDQLSPQVRQAHRAIAALVADEYGLVEVARLDPATPNDLAAVYRFNDSGATTDDARYALVMATLGRAIEAERARDATPIDDPLTTDERDDIMGKLGRFEAEVGMAPCGVG